MGTGSTGRGSSPTTGSPISSPDIPSRVTAAGNGVGGVIHESDDSSLNSMEMDGRFHSHHNIQQQQQQKRGSITYDPECQNVISGSVTTIPVDGGLPNPQVSDRYQEEISRLKADKLELLRQNVASQRELKRLKERESHLQTDLTTASREIHRLRQSLKEALARSPPNPEAEDTF